MRQASDRPQRGRKRPAGCREAFEAGPKCLTLPSEAHKKRGGRLRTGHREAARGLPAAERLLKPVQNASRCLRKSIRREEAGFGQATERPQEACQLPRSFGQATERPQEADKLLKAVQNA